MMQPVPARGHGAGNARGMPAPVRPADRIAGLVARAGTRNAFYEPWLLEPALSHLANGSPLVSPVVPEDAAGEPLGLVPLWPSAYTTGRVWSVWSHRHCFDTTPVVGDRPRDFLAGLFAWLERRGAAVLRWPGLPKDTVFHAHLEAFLDGTGREWAAMSTGERPLLPADVPSAEGYFASVLTGKRRRGLSRCRRRLEEMGRIEVSVAETEPEIMRRASQFLRLEAGGWKGSAGTALMSRPRERAFFEAAVEAGARHGGIIIHTLELNGRPIAMTVNFRSHDTVWAFKTAYDETLRACSPGVLLEIEGSRLLIDDPSVGRVDACTHDSNTLMAELWSGRRPVADLLIAVRPGTAAELQVAVVGERAYRVSRAAAKMLYHTIRMMRRSAR